MAMISQTAGTLPLDRTLGWPEVVRSVAVWRYVGYCMLMGTCLVFYTWSRIDATETALLLNRTRSQATVLQTENEWLTLELATLQDVGVLHGRATQMGLVETIRVRTVR